MANSLTVIMTDDNGVVHTQFHRTGDPFEPGYLYVRDGSPKDYQGRLGELIGLTGILLLSNGLTIELVDSPNLAGGTFRPILAGE